MLLCVGRWIVQFLVLCSCVSVLVPAEMTSKEEQFESLDSLKKELDRLNLELDQTSSEKNQAAQYGLVLLEEKESLQSRCEDLEALYENTKHELESTREVRTRGIGMKGIWEWQGSTCVVVKSRQLFWGGVGHCGGGTPFNTFTCLPQPSATPVSHP